MKRESFHSRLGFLLVSAGCAAIARRLWLTTPPGANLLS